MSDTVLESKATSAVEDFIESQKAAYSAFCKDPVKFMKVYSLITERNLMIMEIIQYLPALGKLFLLSQGYSLEQTISRATRETNIRSLMPDELQLPEARIRIHRLLNPCKHGDLFFYLHLMMLAGHGQLKILVEFLDFLKEQNQKQELAPPVACTYYGFLWQQERELFQRRQWMSKLETEQALFKWKMTIAMYVNYSLDIRDILIRGRSQATDMNEQRKQIEEILAMRRPFEKRLETHQLDEAAINNSYKTIRKTKLMKSVLKKLKLKHQKTGYAKAKELEKHWFEEFGFNGGI